MNYKYITKEEISVAYFQFPKFLLKYPISQNGKVVYMLLYDRARLSQMNNWLDENGRSYKQPLNSLYAFSYSVRAKLSRERSPRGASSCDRSSGYVLSMYDSVSLFSPKSSDPEWELHPTSAVSNDILRRMISNRIGDCFFISNSFLANMSLCDQQKVC